MKWYVEQSATIIWRSNYFWNHQLNHLDIKWFHVSKMLHTNKYNNPSKFKQPQQILINLYKFQQISANPQQTQAVPLRCKSFCCAVYSCGCVITMRWLCFNYYAFGGPFGIHGATILGPFGAVLGPFWDHFGIMWHKSGPRCIQDAPRCFQDAQK